MVLRVSHSSQNVHSKGKGRQQANRLVYNIMIDRDMLNENKIKSGYGDREWGRERTLF